MSNQRNRKELDEVIKRYLAGSASLEETHFVESYFSYVENRATKENPVSEDLTEIRIRLMERIQNGLFEKETAPVVVMHSNRRPWLRIAAAALLIGISFGTYFLIQNRKHTPSEIAVVPVKSDVAPGTNKAVLTLANGSKIMLDSAQNGLLARQNGTNVIKSDSGQLNYKTTSEKTTNVVYNTLTTPRGGQFQLTLPDGTKVWLNAASSITYPTAFKGKERKVTVSGETYFEVAHNARHPFRVKAGDQVIEDIGTSFNVNGYNDESSTKTTLIEGAVKVSVGATDMFTTLKPGQQAEWNGQTMSVKNDIDIDEIVAWKEGTFRFDNTDLKTILRQFARWYDIEVLYEGPLKERKFIGAVSRDNTLQSVLDLLKDNKIAFRIEGKKLIVKSN